MNVAHFGISSLTREPATLTDLLSAVPAGRNEIKDPRSARCLGEIRESVHPIDVSQVWKAVKRPHMAVDGVLDDMRRLDDDDGSFVGNDEVESPFTGSECENADRSTDSPIWTAFRWRAPGGVNFIGPVFHSEQKRNPASDASRCGEDIFLIAAYFQRRSPCRKPSPTSWPRRVVER
jgi:hypothetical protein